jgi:L-ascorbate metabolism protein UlaG (beta-lactamase superfamily)
MARLLRRARRASWIGSGLAFALAAIALAAVDAPLDLSQVPAWLRAPHERDGRYFTPWEARDERSATGILRWWLSPNAFDKSQPPQVPRVANDGAYLAGRAGSASFTWVGHATYALHEGDDVVLTDPIFGKRAMLPSRLHPPGVPIAAIPAHAMAVISHSHYDHLDAWTVDRLPASVRWFVPKGLGEWFRERGRTRVVELDWWESARDGDWRFTCLPSQHWSLRLGFDTNESLWCAWLIESPRHRYFFAGDTGYFAGFAEYGRQFGPIDAAMLPIGAYEPRWFMRSQHMNPAEAYQTYLDLSARYLLPMHWGTFDLTDEPLDLPPRALREEVARRGADPAKSPILAIGERWRLPER